MRPVLSGAKTQRKRLHRWVRFIFSRIPFPAHAMRLLDRFGDVCLGRHSVRNAFRTSLTGCTGKRSADMPYLRAVFFFQLRIILI